MTTESHLEVAPKSSNSRWWEYYAMRYALGVGIGTPIVALLWETYRGALSPKISILSPFSGTIAALFWAAAGTAYCYVASVPMLTLHSTRRALPGGRLWVNTCFVLVIAVLVGTGVCDFCLIGNLLALQCTGVVALVIITGAQLALVCIVLRNPNETCQFYDQLSKQREKNPGFVESYRHMREHGNAVSIVLFELLLAFILWSLKPQASSAVGGNAVFVGRVGLVLTIWLTPSALVWLIGSSLERYLSRSNS